METKMINQKTIDELLECQNTFGWLKETERREFLQSLRNAMLLVPENSESQLTFQIKLLHISFAFRNKVLNRKEYKKIYMVELERMILCKFIQLYEFQDRLDLRRDLKKISFSWVGEEFQSPRINLLRIKHEKNIRLQLFSDNSNWVEQDKKRYFGSVSKGVREQRIRCTAYRLATSTVGWTE
jgi:hypothetical protein